MRGYIVYATYVADEKPQIHLFCRSDEGQPFQVRIPHVPYFYVKKSDMPLAEQLLKPVHEKTVLKDFAGKPVVKIVASKPADVPEMRRALEDQGIATYEADIRFVQRFFMDNGIMQTVRASALEHGFYTKANPAKPFDVKLKVLSLDIETDKAGSQVYSIAVVCDSVKEAHIVSDKKLRNAVGYASEKELLEGFSRRLKELDPDVITGWNVIDFDLNMLQKRYRHHALPFSIGRTEQEARIRIQRDFFRDSSADVPGRVVLDGISLLKQAWISFADYKLDTVADAVLGERKIQLEPDFWDRFLTIIKEDPQRVADYNIKDAELVIRILKEKRLIELMVKKTQLTGLQLDRVRGSIAALDSLYIRRARQAGYVCPTSSFSERTARVTGAYVMQPKPGIYDWIAVFDFKSLYPSVIMTYNIDPIAHRPDGAIVAPNGARFADSEGILPQIIDELGRERENAKREKDDVKSYAIKIIMNSFYGVLANPTCRFYSLEMGNAITGFARSIIQDTVAIIESLGYRVLYGDTDSVFVDLKKDSLKDTEQAAAKLAEKINSHFSKQIRERFNRKSRLELQFEKVFKVLMLPRMRGGEAGAKKRYAGIVIENGREEIKVIGMEIVRRDWTELAKRVQRELLERLFQKKDVKPYIQKIVDDVRSGRLDELLVYRKSIRKELKEYTKTTPPHVKAARMLEGLNSNIIEYCMTEKGPVPVSMLGSAKLDYDHYLEKQVKPIADTILSLFGMSFDELLQQKEQKARGQKNLSDY